MKESLKYLFKTKGFLFFKLGVFFILSAPAIASIFLLISLVSSYLNTNKLQISTRLIIPFFIAGIFAIFSAFISTIRAEEIDYLNKTQSWIGLANWIPFFYFIWRSQLYLQTNEKRKKIANMFLLGTVPFVFSSFAQLVLNLHGPFYFMNGFIIWFQRGIDLDSGKGITAMFNNQNYAACWLIIIWPFCINQFLVLKNLSFKKIVFLIYSIILITCVYLTQSRSGIAGISTSTLFLLNKYFVWGIILLFISYFLATLSFIPISIQSFFRKIFSEKIIQAFQFSNITNFMNEPRIFIYMNTIPLIMERPFLGWGAATFPFLFNSRYLEFTREPTHPHNLILEMAYSYGTIFAIIIRITIFIIVIKSFKIIFLKKTEISDENQRQIKKLNKAWWSSFFALLLSQMYDIQYFDFRISISFWILLCGLICIIKNDYVSNISKKIDEKLNLNK